MPYTCVMMMPMHSFVLEIWVDFGTVSRNAWSKLATTHIPTTKVRDRMFASTFNSFECVEMVEIVCAFMCAVWALLLCYNSCQLLEHTILINRMTKLKVWWHAFLGEFYSEIAFVKHSGKWARYFDLDAGMRDRVSHFFFISFVCLFVSRKCHL